MEDEVMKSGEYPVLVLILFIGILWIPDNLGIASIIISVGLIYTLTPIFNYIKYMNRYVYWILVFMIIIAILIPGTLLVPPSSGNALFNYGLITLAIIISICLAYTKMKKLERLCQLTK